MTVPPHRAYLEDASLSGASRASPEKLPNALAEKILVVAWDRAEGQPLTARTLPHLGARPAVDQALARLTRQGELLCGQGVYVGRWKPVRRPPAAKTEQANLGRIRNSSPSWMARTVGQALHPG